MNYFKAKSAGYIGNKLIMIDIECVQQRRLPFLQIIGGPAGVLASQRERIMAALDSSGFKLPARRITVSIAGAFPGVSTEPVDLAICLVILGSCGLFPQEKLRDFFICGSLSLDGKLLPTPSRAPLRTWVESRPEISLVLPWEDSQVLADSNGGGGFQSLGEVVEFFRGKSARAGRQRVKNSTKVLGNDSSWHNLSGRPVSQRIAQVAAAGSHPIILTGGMEGDAKAFAEAVYCLFPLMSDALVEEVGAIRRSFGELDEISRPFRRIRADQAPRLFRFDSHSGLWGDLSLAHGGILYLQDLGEKPASLMQRLQEPLESGGIRSFRAGQSVFQPADWALIASGALCPCGSCGVRGDYCRCAPAEIERFRARMDQIRVFFHLRYHVEEPVGTCEDIPIRQARERVANAAEFSKGRRAVNSRLSLDECFSAKRWSEDALGVWRSSKGQSWAGMSTALARVALTISDLKNAAEISREDVLEARHYIPSPFASLSRSGRSFSKVAGAEMNSTAIP